MLVHISALHCLSAYWHRLWDIFYHHYQSVQALLQTTQRIVWSNMVDSILMLTLACFSTPWTHSHMHSVFHWNFTASPLTGSLWVRLVLLTIWPQLSSVLCVRPVKVQHPQKYFTDLQFVGCGVRSFALSANSVLAAFCEDFLSLLAWLSDHWDGWL